MFLNMKAELKAVSLKNHLDIAILPTAGIQDHLRFDRKINTLEAYHYTAFLKEQLRVTKGMGDCSSPSSTLNQ